MTISISIVTPSYNQGQYIEETIDSLLSQHYPNLEYIIIDGGSTDNTVEIIKKYENHLTYWVSEPDQGQTHAINKGLMRCTGQIFNWINSDDLLEKDALQTIATLFRDEVDLLAGSVINFGQAHRETIISHDLTPLGMLTGQATYHQPGVWLRTDILQRVGGIDERFNYAFDWDMTIRYLSHTQNIVYTEQPLARFRLHDESKTVSQQPEFRQERLAILKKLHSLDITEPWHDLIDQRIRQMEWNTLLTKIQTDDALSPTQRIVRILKSASSDPSIRWNRRTLGSIRQAISQ